jgi:hypothetical protein
MTVLLKNWSIILDRWYLPPEYKRAHLKGYAYGHPEYKDGTLVKTSIIVETEGFLVKTATGTIYLLEDPDPEYILWLRLNHLKFNNERPFEWRDLLN